MIDTTVRFLNDLTGEQEKYGLIFCYKNQTGVLEKTLELLNTPGLKQTWQIRRQKMLAEKLMLRLSWSVWWKIILKVQR